MGEFIHMPASNKKFETSNNLTSQRMTKSSLVGSSPKSIPQRNLKSMIPLKHVWQEGGPMGQIVLFLLKVAALETVRRFSRGRCPFIWQALQALQVLSYSPFKWIQRWAPLRNLVTGVQKISRPLLFLSITTALSDHSESYKKTFNNAEDSQESETYSEAPTAHSASEQRTSDEAPENAVSESWFLRLHKELEVAGVTLPERIDEDELRRFHTAVYGDFSSLLASVRKTIRWRETYYILSSQELEMWSHLVFWHGCDVKLRPCLIIRLGLACSSLAPHERPRFSQAVVSQIEHGVLYLVNGDDPQITVLIDCEGLSPIRFPMQMLRSCSALVQDHYPGRLGTLFVIRLPPVVCVIAHTFIQVLRPSTRQKLRFEGKTYQKVLSEFLQSVPSFLGGKCTCARCGTLGASNTLGQTVETSKNVLSSGNFSDDDLTGDPCLTTDIPLNGNCEQFLRNVIIGVLMLWIFFAFLAGMQDPDNFSSLAS